MHPCPQHIITVCGHLHYAVRVKAGGQTWYAACLYELALIHQNIRALCVESAMEIYNFLSRISFGLHKN